MTPVSFDTDAFLSAQVVNEYRFIATAAHGAVILERTMLAVTCGHALREFWQGMTVAQRATCVHVECLDV